VRENVWQYLHQIAADSPAVCQSQGLRRGKGATLFLVTPVCNIQLEASGRQQDRETTNGASCGACWVEEVLVDRGSDRYGWVSGMYCGWTVYGKFSILVKWGLSVGEEWTLLAVNKQTGANNPFNIYAMNRQG